MGEQTHAGVENSPSLEVVPAIGILLSGVAMTGVLVPFRDGETDLAVIVALSLALVSLCAFLVRRHGRLSRSTTGIVTAASSLGVVLATAYALNQGLTGTVTLSIGPWSSPISLVMASFLSSGVAIGIGVSEYGGLTGTDLADRTRQTLLLTMVSLSMFIAAALWATFLLVPTSALLGELSELQDTAFSQFVVAFATATVAVGYLLATDRDWSFIDLRMPTVRDLGWVAGGIVVLVGSALTIQFLVASTPIEQATHSSIETGQENPEILLLLAGASILIIGPFEELLYRNVIQKSLYDSFSRPGAIVVASVIFAAVHFTAYAATDAVIGETLVSLGVVFVLSLILGVIYERSRNLFVPAVVHGLYNAFVFVSQYMSVT